MKMMLHNLWILTSVQVIVCQVNTDIKLLQDEFFKDTSSFTWFNQQKLKDNPKFLLCVDVYQKTEKMRIMEGRYTTYGGYNTMSLPDFKLEDVIVIDAYNETDRYKFVTSILCPFSSIAFEKNAFNYGVDFYITPKTDAFCVYMLSVKFKYPNGTTLVHITAEVCDVMADIRNNQVELATELAHHLDIHLTREQEWKQFQENNTLRYFTCLDVHEKITGIHLSTQPIDGELPIFKNIMVVLDLTVGIKSQSAILCPMHIIKFTKRNYIIPTPYYIAPSINKGCVYKLQLNSSAQISALMDTDYRAVVNIQQEICGIFEPVRHDIEQLEKEFSDTWIVDHKWPKNEAIPWPDVQSLKKITIYGVHTCENVYKKIHQSSVIKNKHVNRMTSKVLRLELRTIHEETRPIWALYCPMHLLNYDIKDIQPYYITNSVNIGCVYVLFSRKRQVIAHIEYEVCGVYPIPYLFNI